MVQLPVPMHDGPMSHLLFLTAFLLTSTAADARELCAKRGTSIVVDTREHEMTLCLSNKPVQMYKVSLGRGGVNKRKQGDLKTPLGTYSLGTPRVSKKFGLFIPIGYPTPEQKRTGFTGADVGIHGPARNYAWARRLNTLVDWTQGCVAVASDEAMKEVAAWVQSKRPMKVHLE